ncbi:hypothetical protein CDD80_7419 [Ophiocordyceps camponoti-rufipedis]|uniref:Transcription factor domain-containing protein n=1 Tax=Ophiocordyceps camponoti-rufipedis TaxID=2004952 RepID=A0A2C5XQT3_9HYPO|nr:hypothetical protein CDD80_7419 [Ophiocordyceps camponoti-rufipedis]
MKRNYKGLRKQLGTNAEFVDLLKNLPYQDAQVALRSFRSGTDIASIVSHFKVGNILLEMAVSPETRFRYVFPYRSELPQDIMLDNPYLDSTIYESATLYSGGQFPTCAKNLNTTKAGNPSCSEHQKPYLHPFHATQVIDPLLSAVRPSSWTAVCSDDVLMRDLLAGFLRCEYQFTAAFQKDYFLEDMSCQQSEFCSQLLVNIVLAYSCAAILFNVFYNLCGLDEVGQRYITHAVDLAHKICLFDVSVTGLEKAGELQSQLQSWFTGLARPLRPRTIVLPGHFQLHMYYHHLILAMYEPLLETGANQPSLPLQMVTAARKYLQTLVRLYYLRHGFDAMNLFIVIPLMLVGAYCIDSINEQTPEPSLEALRSTLILVAKGLAGQRRSHYLANALFRVVRGRMRPREAALLRYAADANEEEDVVEPPMAQAVRSHWPVSVVRNLRDVDSYTLTNLVESYAQLNVEEVDAASEGDDCFQ